MRVLLRVCKDNWQWSDQNTSYDPEFQVGRVGRPILKSWGGQFWKVEDEGGEGGECAVSPWCDLRKNAQKIRSSPMPRRTTKALNLRKIRYFLERISSEDDVFGHRLRGFTSKVEEKLHVDWFGREGGDAAAISNFHMLKPLLRGKDCPHGFDLSTLSWWAVWTWGFPPKIEVFIAEGLQNYKLKGFSSWTNLPPFWELQIQ